MGETGMQDMIGVIDGPAEEPVQTELPVPAAEPEELNADCGNVHEDEIEDAAEPSNEDPRFSDLVDRITAIEKRGEARSLEVEEEAQAAVDATGERIHDRVEDRFAEQGERIHTRVAERGAETLEPGEQALGEEGIVEDHLKYLSPDIGLAIANGHDIYDVMNSPEVPQKDRDILKAEYEEIYKELSNSEFSQEPGHHPDDDFEAYEATAFEQMAQKIYDMYSKNSEDRDGGMFGENPLDSFPELDFTEEGAERDIQHANTPDERTAGVDMVTHGTSGGLNKPKQMFKKEYPGDNPMAVTEDAGDKECKWCGNEFAADKVKDHEETCDYIIPKDLTKEEVAEDDKPDFFVNEHENVDNFLDLYKEFQIRGEKKS